MLNNKLKIVLAAIGVGAIALVGIGRSNIAQASLQNGVAVVHQQKQAIQVAMGKGDSEKDDAAEDQQQSAKLRPLAKITPQQAQQAAETSQGSRASSVKLENDDGSVVYAVVIGQAEVKVDAGNGRVLYTENTQENDQEGAEPNHPKSSIQISAAIGDGDGETNDDG